MNSGSVSLASDGSHVSQYDPAATRQLLGEAGRLIRGVGFSGAHLTFIGGLVPMLLVPILDPGIEPHVGSGDIDLCLSIALTSGEVGAYERIERALRELGYKMKPQGGRAASSWQWVGGSKVSVTVEFFCAQVAQNKPGTLYRPAGDVTKGLSALTLATGALVDRDLVEVKVEVDLPDGERTTLPFRVTAPAAFLASKSDALARRSKNKDPYDIVWICEGWPGGQKALADVVRRSPIWDEPAMQGALRDLRGQFRGVDSLGARAYARFLQPLRSTDLDTRSRRASGAVLALLDADALNN